MQKQNNKCIKKWFKVFKGLMLYCIKAFIMQFLCLQPFDASIGSTI